MARQKHTVLIFGAAGLLGHEFTAQLKREGRWRVAALPRDRADITDLAGVKRVIRRTKPHAIINCAALIDVDVCSRNPRAAFEVNAIGPSHIALALQELSFKKTLLIHVSTSDIFGDDRRAFSETDEPHPVNAYGVSKLAGEQMLTAVAGEAGIPTYILRTSWLYGAARKTFIDSLVAALRRNESIKAIVDQASVPTWTRDFVAATLRILRQPKKFGSGIYHLVAHAPQPVNRFTIAREIARLLGVSPRLVGRTTRRAVFAIPRPRSAFLKNMEFPALPEWRASLAFYLKQKSF